MLLIELLTIQLGVDMLVLFHLEGDLFLDFRFARFLRLVDQ